MYTVSKGPSKLVAKSRRGKKNSKKKNKNKKFFKESAHFSPSGFNYVKSDFVIKIYFFVF